MPWGTRIALTVVLFTIYAAVLVGVVLFKFPFSYQLTGGGRVLNLIPFAGSITSHGVSGYGQIVDNVLIFMPLGIYICALKDKWSFPRKVLTIIGITVAFETIQYVFAIGRADVTDVLANTLGGLIGIGVYAAIAKVLNKRTNRVVSIVALILTICALLFLTVLFIRSSSVYA